MGDRQCRVRQQPKVCQRVHCDRVSFPYNMGTFRSYPLTRTDSHIVRRSLPNSLMSSSMHVPLPGGLVLSTQSSSVFLPSCASVHPSELTSSYLVPTPLPTTAPPTVHLSITPSGVNTPGCRKTMEPCKVQEGAHKCSLAWDGRVPRGEVEVGEEEGGMQRRTGWQAGGVTPPCL